MRYMLLIYSDPKAGEDRTEADWNDFMKAYGAFTQMIQESGEFEGGEPLQGVDTATTVRVKNGDVETTDGPFAETKEILGGYYLVDCKDLDRAIEVAAQIPTAALGLGGVEVRPVEEMSAP